MQCMPASDSRSADLCLSMRLLAGCAAGAHLQQQSAVHILQHRCLQDASIHLPEGWQGGVLRHVLQVSTSLLVMMTLLPDLFTCPGLSKVDRPMLSCCSPVHHVLCSHHGARVLHFTGPCLVCPNSGFYVQATVWCQETEHGPAPADLHKRHSWAPLNHPAAMQARCCMPWHGAACEMHCMRLQKTWWAVATRKTYCRLRVQAPTLALQAMCIYCRSCCASSRTGPPGAAWPPMLCPGRCGGCTPAPWPPS